MGSVLVVCTGNVCRSPLGEGFLRRALDARMGEAAPEVRSAGTAGWEGSGATRESVEAGAERGLDISAHAARRLTPGLLDGVDLVVAMAKEHRDTVASMAPSVAGRAFTLKELTRLAEALQPAELHDHATFLARVEAAGALRRNGFEGNLDDEDVADPLGMPLQTYRAIAWELEEWSERLAQGLVGRLDTGSGTGIVAAIEEEV
jgi:protein-tyrosine phosphatase